MDLSQISNGGGGWNISMMHLVERYCENEALISLKKKEKEEDNET